MSVNNLDINEDTTQVRKQRKFDWYWGLIFCAVWFLLFYVAVIPSFYAYPETLHIEDEHLHPDEFIGERAQRQLMALSTIGVKLTGTVENEVLALNYLLNEVEKIKAAARTDLYDIDVEVQYSSGQFMLWSMPTSYHNVSNIIVRIAPKNSNSQTYLLVNSHFDSEVDSPAAADAGIMIVIMLETLRVISISERPLRNPVVFLLNGAEEANLLASHGFITQHRWAPYCKALINLDSAGSGGREILFQSGPNHPWLMKYYKQSVPHPFASTVAEELFQNNFIPSDTDFRIFRDYRGVPGLDMAHTLNGYIYHTKYDNFQNLERGSYQTTGDNVLALTWALANAEELEDTDAYAEGHTVFYDFMGWFMVFYTESASVAINITTSVCALIAIGISVYLMTKRKDADEPKQIWIRFGVIALIQLIANLAAVGLVLLVAVLMAAFGLTLSWYSEEWMIFGLYFCPIFFVLGLLPGMYICNTKNKTSMSLDDSIACFMHAHCIFLAVSCIITTCLSIRSAFFIMVAIFFYTISVILNMLIRWLTKRNYFLIIHLVCELLPFWFYTYMAFASLKTFVPMQGRDGPTSTPEILLGTSMSMMSLLFAGFIMPLLQKFRKSKTLSCAFAVITIIFIIIAATPAAFPYKRAVAPQRFYVLHTNRIIHDDKGLVSKNESGYYIQPVDTHPTSIDDTTLQNALSTSWTEEECAKEVFCGLPLYSTRWMKWKDSARWVPAELPNLLVPTELTQTSKVYESDTRIRYGFSLKSADRIVIYVDPLTDIKVTDWSFDRTPIDDNFSTPYFIYHAYSMSDDPLEFYIEIERPENYEGHSFRLGIGIHFLYTQYAHTDEFKAFLASFPEWAYPINWSASYESWYF